MAELKFTQDHECIYVEDDIAWIGISQYAREALGDLVFLELPEIGKTVSKGDDVAVVESVKTAAEVYSPVDGEVVEVNEAMVDDLELLDKPGAWITKVKMTDANQLSDLMDEAAYKDFVAGLD
jgi:glycine cleavage system H protein